MKTNSQSTNSNTNSDTSNVNTANPVSDNAPMDTGNPADNTQTDDFGYDIVDKKAEEKVDEPKKDETPAATNEPAKDDKPADKKSNLSGYGDEPSKDDEPANEPAKDEPKSDDKPADEEAIKKEIASVVETLGDGFNKEKIAKFAIDHKLSKEQVEAYVSLAKEDQATAIKEHEEKVKAQRSSWVQELKADPSFGGVNFDRNLDKVEKLLEKNLTNTKKVLTEKGGMLPPYIMRDLLEVANLLNPVTNFVKGDEFAPKTEEKHFLEDLYGN